MDKRLKDLLNEETIFVLDKVESWKEAVIIGSKPLIEKEVINTKYQNAMIEAVEKYGPYMVLAEGFALMHARPEDGASQVGMSMVVLKEAVDLKGEDIKLFVILAAKDSKSHLAGLAEIASLVGDNDIYKRILESDKSQIIEIIEKEMEV